MRHKIGVFDSGIGGLTTLQEIKKLLPEEEYFYIGDHENNPYGEKSLAELCEITSDVVKKLRRQGVEMIVIACNTATTKCLPYLRQRFPEIKFVGMEPAIKVAHDGGYRRTLLLATPNTAGSKPVQRLLEQYGKTCHFTVIPCYELAGVIERSLRPFLRQYEQDNFGTPPVNAVELRACYPTEIRCPAILQERANAWQQISNLTLASQPTAVRETLDQLLAPVEHPERYDAVILGCTHYVHIRPLVAERFPHAALLDGGAGVARRVVSLLQAA